nr:L-glutamate gamma-semialdehyde dehydrogenase [Desulforhopalus singaporensis]
MSVPAPQNENILGYGPGSPEKKEVKAALQELMAEQFEIPLIIGGREVKTGNLGKVVCPHDHGKVLATYHKAGKEEVQLAIESALSAQKMWQTLPWEQRLAIFLTAAELIATRYRAKLNAGAMLAGGKTVFQAEIDAACELIDFLRFNAGYARELYAKQPQSSQGVWNYTQYRALEGFVFAVTPFNFTAIAGNLPSAPAMMGNTVVWKPASSLVYTPYFIMRILEEAGLPPGVINFVPGAGSQVGDVCLADPNLAGVHFTGSTRVFHQMWKTIGENIASYRSYPRIVGETGGKDFVFAHPSAEIPSLVTALVRGAFEYQGQKCSAASRAYIPQSLWDRVKSLMLAQVGRITMGSPVDFRNFMGAVIDRSAFESITGYIDFAKEHKDAEIIAGGNYDDTTGYFIEPTVIVATDPEFKTMVEEIFGPVLTIFVYQDEDFVETLELCDKTSPYALTGAFFAKDRNAITLAMAKLEHAAGNFYINDKPTGAVVGQQPFGGGRASGTNDKAGSQANLARWVSVRTVKETFVPPGDFPYSFMDEE